MSGPCVTIVVVNWNGLDLTSACLDSIGGLDHPERETIVVDNGSTDGSVEALGRRGDVRVIEAGSNLGFARAANLGIRAARGDLVLLLNNDVVLDDPGVLTEAVAFQRAHPDAGAVSVRLRGADGETQESCGRFHSLRAEVLNSLPARALGIHRDDLLRYTPDDHRRTGPVDWAIAAFLLVPRRALDRVGLLDERRFMYGEDYDLCWRLARVGLRTYHLGSASATHLGNATASRAFSEEERLIRVVTSARAFMAAHRGAGYAWLYALVVLADRASKLLVARLLGHREMAGRLRRELAVRVRSLARR